jgi:hypothetical protein
LGKVGLDFDLAAVPYDVLDAFDEVVNVPYVCVSSNLDDVSLAFLLTEPGAEEADLLRGELAARERIIAGWAWFSLWARWACRTWRACRRRLALQNGLYGLLD